MQRRMGASSSRKSSEPCQEAPREGAGLKPQKGLCSWRKVQGWRGGRNSRRINKPAPRGLQLDGAPFQGSPRAHWDPSLPATRALIFPPH